MTYRELKTYTGSPEYIRRFWNVARGQKSAEEWLTSGRVEGLGSYTVPDDTNTKFMNALKEESLFRQIATVVKAYDSSSHILAKECEDLAMFVPEGKEIPIYDGINDFTTLPVDRWKLAGLVRLDEDFVHDATFDIENYLIRRFARVFGRAETNAFLIGSGEDMPTGVLCPDKGAETAVSTDNITYDDVISLYFSLKPEYRDRAVWIMNDTTELYIKTLKDTDGNYLWRESDDTILGKPVITSEFMPDIDSGSMPIIVGDFSYYWVLARSPFSIRTLEEMFAAVGQLGYLGFEFLDGKLVRREAVKAIQMN